MRSHKTLGAFREAVRTTTVTQHEPLTSIRRNYPLKKIQENNEAEIMEVVADEARSSYPAEIVVELTSESTEDLEKNVTRIVQWINAWREQQKQKQDGE